MFYSYPPLLDKSIAPKSAGDIKLIHAGKILDDGRTLAESRIPIGDVSGGVITMHVVVQPPNSGKKTGILAYATPRIQHIRGKQSFCL